MKIFKSISLIVLAILFALGMWGFVVEPRFLLDVQTHDVEVPNLGSDWEGEKVALLADLQVGMWWGNTGMIKKAVREAVEAKPRMVLIAGDFVYKADSSVVNRAVSLLQPIVEAKIPVVAVLGNHDYSLAKEDDEINDAIADYLMTSLYGMGIVVLENDSYSLTNESGSSFHVIGLGSMWAFRSDIGKAFSKIPANEPRVVIMHNPVVYRDIPADMGAFTLAAHTHGGQINFPLVPASKSWLDIALPREVVAEGWAEDGIGRGKNRLYVNRGIGFSLLPIRFFCRPELTIFNLWQTDDTLAQPDSVLRDYVMM